MKRLFKNLESTFPFVNDDFVNILQNQHIIAYSAYLDGMNDRKYSTFSTNRGIVLRGIDVEATPQTTFEHFDWNFTVDQNALVYFDGQYYSPDPQYADQIVPFTNLRKIYIYPTSATVSRVFKSGLTQSMITSYTFQFSDATNTSGGPDFTGVTQGVPHIEFSRGGTSRNFSRLLRLNSLNKGDVIILTEPKSWNVSWINPLYDYSKYGYFRDFGPAFSQIDSNGRNELEGFALMHDSSGNTGNDMAGRFVLALDYQGSTSPVNAIYPQINSGLINNKGGAVSVTLTSNQLGAHDHSGKVDFTAQNLDHSHGIYSGLRVDWNSQQNKPFEIDQTPKAIPAGTPGPATDIYLSRSYPIFKQSMYPFDEISVISPENWSSTTDPGVPNSNNHKHQINSSGSGLAHENRPPYMVVLYVYKK